MPVTRMLRTRARPLFTSARFLGSSTASVWGGEGLGGAHERSEFGAGTQVPIVSSVGFGYDSLDKWNEVALGREDGHIYSRNTNPTVRAFERKVAALEGGAAAVAFASGMAAVSNTLWALLRPGARVVTSRDLYGGSALTFLEHLPRFGVQAELVAHADLAAEIAKGCDVVYLETPTNPSLKVVDVAELAAAGRAAGAVVIVDNTFATPILQNPLSLGAHLVLHSASKFLGGHADVLGGVLCGDAELVRRVFEWREIDGACLDPSAAYSLLRGMKTLQLRVERQSSNAMAVARFLEAHPAVEGVRYPGLPSHPEHAIAAAQMRGGFGGMLAFSLHQGWPAVEAALPRLRLAHRCANLGAVETVVGPPRTTSHVECTAEERAALGIPEGLVRYSAGIADPHDLVQDLEQALGAM